MSSDDHHDESPPNATDASSSVTAERRRQIMLLRILFWQHLQNRRRQYSSFFKHQNTAPSTSSPPGMALRILSNDDAISSGAICRFCLEGVTVTSSVDEESENGSDNHTTKNRLVAPCDCSGGSEWVHVQCLRKWQRQVLLFSRDQQNTAATRCNICTAQYRLPPLPPPRLNYQFFKQGTLLVEANGSSGTFHRTVILLLNDVGGNGTTCGLIINSALVGRTEIPSAFQDVIPDDVFVTWKRGGPVCGGRLGALRYIIAHTLDVQEDGEGSEYESLGVFNSDGESETPPVRFVYEKSNLRSPAMFQGVNLQDAVRKLTQSCSMGRLMLFSGYCKWKKGQLEREILRGTWSVCKGRLEDVLNDSVESMWEEIRGGERLLNPQELFVEEDDFEEVCSAG